MVATTVDRARLAFDRDGWVVLDEAFFGITRCDRKRFHRLFFSNLGPEHPGAKPVDRWRARDKWHFRRNGGQVDFRESDSVKLVSAANLQGEHLRGVERDFVRVRSIEDQAFRGLVEMTMAIIKNKFDKLVGTISINFYQTHTNVVSGKHDDGTIFAVYVFDKNCNGATTTLWLKSNPEELVAKVTIRPGRILIVDDERFVHDVSPLEAKLWRRLLKWLRLIEHSCQRDAAVIHFE